MDKELTPLESADKTLEEGRPLSPNEIEAIKKEIERVRSESIPAGERDQILKDISGIITYIHAIMTPDLRIKKDNIIGEEEIMERIEKLKNLKDTSSSAEEKTAINEAVTELVVKLDGAIHNLEGRSTSRVKLFKNIRKNLFVNFPNDESDTFEYKKEE